MAEQKHDAVNYEMIGQAFVSHWYKTYDSDRSKLEALFVCVASLRSIYLFNANLLRNGINGLLRKDTIQSLQSTSNTYLYDLYATG